MSILMYMYINIIHWALISGGESLYVSSVREDSTPRCIPASTVHMRRLAPVVPRTDSPKLANGASLHHKGEINRTISGL